MDDSGGDSLVPTLLVVLVFFYLATTLGMSRQERAVKQLLNWAKSNHFTLVSKRSVRLLSSLDEGDSDYAPWVLRPLGYEVVVKDADGNERRALITINDSAKASAPANLEWEGEGNA